LLLPAKCKPVKSILDRSFHYTPSVETDLRKTFARLRREEKQNALHVSDQPAINVVPMRTPAVLK
jgi:hypothetical protein